MRNAAELIALADATGTYADYVGDGASVPWELVSYPANFLLYTYKLYLDARWPEAFKLHDWCYTPLGALIQVTREEADHALFEMIFFGSPVDAAIVYAAVRQGGGAYFGISTTGLTNPLRRNMALTGKDVDSMPTKVVMIMKDNTTGVTPAQNRIAGFSESVWHSSDDIATVRRACFEGSIGPVGLVPARANILPASAAIVGLKFYKGGVGKGTTQRIAFPGNAAWPTDVPNLALQCSNRSDLTGGVRRWLVHAIPDQFIVTGEFAPNTAFQLALSVYFIALQSFGFYTRPSNQTGSHITTIVGVPPVAPATVPTGLVTTVEPHGFGVGDQVTIYSTNLTNGTKVTVTMRVTAVPSATQFVFGTWPNGNTTGGIAGSPLKTFDSFNNATFGLGSISTRKVGRPFDQFRGRRSKRRKVA